MKGAQLMKTLARLHLAKLGGAILIAALAIAALPGIASADEEIQGTVQSINGTWNITVLDVNGYLDNVGLHQGTIINPTGLTLAPGMSVTILGYTDGNVFEANEIDTPYQYSGPPPVPIYYGPGWWYPGYAYGYGPSFSLVLAFGGGDRDDWVQREPWEGHWWAPAPVHPYVGFWMGHDWDGNWHPGPVAGWQGGAAWQGAPQRRYPEQHAYAGPATPTYRAPVYRAPVYRAPPPAPYPQRNATLPCSTIARRRSATLPCSTIARRSSATLPCSTIALPRNARTARSAQAPFTSRLARAVVAATREAAAANAARPKR